MLASPSQVCEVYFLLEPNHKKDSSTEVTVLNRALEEMHTILRETGTTVPGHLVVEVRVVAGGVVELAVFKFVCCHCRAAAAAAHLTQTDNTAREGKNATCLLAGAKLEVDGQLLGLAESESVSEFCC